MAKIKLTPEQREKATFMSPEGRLSYPHLFEPQAMPGTENKPKYSATLLIPKDTDIAVAKKAIAQAKRNFFGKDKETWPKMSKPTITDGDDDTRYPTQEAYREHWVIKPNSNADSKPVVVDAKGKKIIDASKAYAGVDCQMSLYAYVWEFPVGKYGVGLILEGVQILRDNEPFSTRKTAEQMFGAAAEDESEDESEEDEE